MKKEYSFLLLIFLSFVLASCDDDIPIMEGITDKDIQPISDNINIEKGIVEVISYANPYGLDGYFESNYKESSPMVSLLKKDEIIIEIDFSNMTGYGGKILVGYKVNSLYSDSEIFKATVELKEFVYKESVYNGIFDFSLGEGLFPVFIITNEYREALTVRTRGLIASWLGLKTLTWIEGSNTPFDRYDDTFLVSGSGMGVSGLGYSYSSVTNDLVVSDKCEYIMDGTIELDNYIESDLQTRLELNFGVNASGNELSELICNSSFNLKFIDGSNSVIRVMNMNDI